MLPVVRQWIDERTKRERYLLLIAAVLAGLWTGYAGLWQPLARQEAALLSQINRYDRAIVMLRRAPLTEPQTTRVDTRPVTSIVTETAENFSLSIRRLEPEGSGAQVVLDETGFENLLYWLDQLEHSHGLRVITTEINRRPAPGTVTATITLQR